MSQSDLRLPTRTFANRWLLGGTSALLVGLALIGHAAAPGTSASAPSMHTSTADSKENSFILTLDLAMGRTLDKHPDLKLFDYEATTLRAAADIASQSPPLDAGVRIQNALGTNETTGLRNAEIALTLASVLERGGKREARQSLASGQLDALGNARAAKRLDLLAEVARRYLDVVAAQVAGSIAELDVAQRERTVAAAAKRLAAGASPEATKLAAEALLVRAQIERTRSTYAMEAAYRRLAILWNERAGPTMRVAGDALSLPDVADFAELADLLERTPDMQRFADESRIREARLQLARSARSPDLAWEVGIQRLQDFSSWGLLAGVSIPLGASRRAEPQVRAAESEVQALALERESSDFTLYATLAQAYGQYVADKVEVQGHRSELLPRLVRAEAVAERAYRAGALSYLEWAQVQDDTIAALRSQLAAATQAQRALIEIQRLTGEPFVIATAHKDTDP